MTCDCAARSFSGRTPFEVTSFGWYDGPLSGIARCRACEATYEFQLLAEERRSDDADRRAYGFRHMDRAAYATCVADPQKVHRPDDSAALVFVVLADDLVEDVELRRIDFADWQRLFAGARDDR